VAARRLLQRRHLWQPLQGHLAIGQNAAQAAHYAASGAADAGLIPTVLARAAPLRERGRCLPLATASDATLPHYMVLLRGARPQARSLYRWLRAGTAREILRRNGFLAPEQPH